MTNILVIDVGTSGLRSSVVDDTLTVRALSYRPFPPDTPTPGLVEFDAAAMAEAVVESAREVISEAAGAVDAVGITNQRASTIVWDRETGVPISPGLGWQDLRTVGECIVAKAEYGWTIAPNQSVTKLAWILDDVEGARDRDLCFGTVESWIAWTLSGGGLHVSDQTNASATTTGLRSVDGRSWNDDVLEAFDIPAGFLPTVVDSIGICGEASELPGAPVIASMLGDQQASLVGQGCVHAGQTKITFGTGGMLDVCTDLSAPSSAGRHAAGTYPLPIWSKDGVLTWGVEGIMLSAGTNVEWLRDDLGLIETAAGSHDLAQACDDSGGVVYVPALLGLGTPKWDYGARGTLLGLTRGTNRAQVARAVLEGVAHRGADLLEAAEAHIGSVTDAIRVDGGMSQNPTFVQALADATGRRVEVSPIVESTTLGAAFLAGLATGVWGSIEDADELWTPAVVHEPQPDYDRAAARLRWAEAIERSSGWLEDLSSLDF